MAYPEKKDIVESPTMVERAIVQRPARKVEICYL